MQLHPGHVVIHPFHGPATVVRHVTRALRGHPTEYAELRVAGIHPLTIAVPVGKVNEVGLREVAGKTELESLAIVLCAPTGKEESNWARRIKAHGIKLQTGELLLIAEAARDLIRRRESSGISLAEKEILGDALSPIVAEVAVAVDVSPERASDVIEQLVLTGDRAVIAMANAA